MAKKWETAAGARNYDVKSQIDKIVINTEARLLAVVRQSISDVVEDMQTPTAQGGKMRVKTGFLRRSGAASLNAPPVGQGTPVKGQPVEAWNADTLNTALAKMKIGDVLYFGWTANYAKYREAFDGFLESGLQKWQTYVDKAVLHFKNKDMIK
jgi:hypothetical protein